MQFEIKLTTDVPVKARPYRTNPVNQKEIDAHIEKLLKIGAVTHSTSNYASPALVVPKKQGTTRLVVDYRALNRISVPDNYPMVLIDDLLATLGGTKVFSSLDLRCGYNQISVHPNSRHLTAFVTQNYLCEYTVMPFGHRNSGATFCRLIEHTLGGLTNKCAKVFINDILCFSPDLTSHIEDLREIFTRLRGENLKLRPDKCVFLKKEVPYLGSVISAQGGKS